jgi:catechol-2,3-dioxygenase
MASPVKLAHIVLQTGNVALPRDWWCTVLEAKVVWEGAGMTFLTYDDEHHRIAIVAPPGVEASQRLAAGLHHVAFTYKGLPDLLRVYGRLRGVGVTPTLCINHGPTLSMYYEDPDGNSAELQVDCFDDVADATAFMNGPYFAKNPIGYKVDPDELVAQVAAGVPVASLLVRRDVARDRSDSASATPSNAP